MERTIGQLILVAVTLVLIRKAVANFLRSWALPTISKILLPIIKTVSVLTWIVALPSLFLNKRKLVWWVFFIANFLVIGVMVRYWETLNLKPMVSAPNMVIFL